MTKFRIEISTLIVAVGCVAFLGTAAHADGSGGFTDQYYAPPYVPRTTIVTPTLPPATTPSPPPTLSPPPTDHGSQLLPSAATVPPPNVKVVTESQGAPAAPLAATGSLAFTGTDVASLVGIALLLLIVGAALIHRNRHRVPTRS